MRVKADPFCWNGFSPQGEPCMSFAENRRSAWGRSVHPRLRHAAKCCPAGMTYRNPLLILFLTLQPSSVMRGREISRAHKKATRNKPGGE